MSAPSKPCGNPACTVRIVQVGNRAFEFKAREYCSLPCFHAVRVPVGRTPAQVVLRECEARRCTKTIPLGSTRRASEYAGKRFCSRSCASAERAAVRADNHEEPVRRRPRRTAVKPTIDQVALAQIGPLHGPERPPWRPAGFAPAPRIPAWEAQAA